jgi:hypothetical protein
MATKSLYGSSDTIADRDVIMAQHSRQHVDLNDLRTERALLYAPYETKHIWDSRIRKNKIIWTQSMPWIMTVFTIDSDTIYKVFSKENHLTLKRQKVSVYFELCCVNIRHTFNTLEIQPLFSLTYESSQSRNLISLVSNPLWNINLVISSCFYLPPQSEDRY